MQNSGIVLERVPGEESTLEPAPPSESSPLSLGEGPPELPLLEVEQIETVGFFCCWHDLSVRLAQCLSSMLGGGCHLYALSFIFFSFETQSNVTQSVPNLLWNHC